MDLVVDANILISALIKESTTSDMLFRNDLHLFAPEFIFLELEKHKKEVKNKIKRTEEDFERLIKIFERRIEIIPKEEIEVFLERAEEISPDIKDVAYVALALKLNCCIWSNDKILRDKQSIIKVYSTNELYDRLKERK